MNRRSHSPGCDELLFEPEWEAYADVLDNDDYMAAHDTLRDKYFLPVRPVQTYVDALTDAGFELLDEVVKVIPARVDEWFSFLAVYHEGVLGWVGGAERVTREKASPEVVGIETTIRTAMDVIFEDVDLRCLVNLRARKPL